MFEEEMVCADGVVCVGVGVVCWVVSYTFATQKSSHLASHPRT